ncbi:hypothetical protein [Nostoc sp.]|uniref:hypothetical protein n=1 Tax=Nostoc sp. TaxID=1180 RepID=UPI002FF44674
MTNSLTDTKPNDIITHVENFNFDQAIGLNCLLFLAVREQTTVAYQCEEMGFEDIPKQIVTLCDQLDDDALLKLAGQITLTLIAEENAAALDEENAQPFAVQELDG